MLDWIFEPWPWWISGPAIGLTVPTLLVVGNRMLGVSGNLRATCAAVAPGRADYFRFDWKRVAGWNLLFALGIGLGGLIAATLLGGGGEVAISEATRADLAALGITSREGLAPVEIFSWSSLGTVRGLVFLLFGGFLVGFGASYAGGCTSGHAILGLADFQLPSLVAVIGFFAGGLAVTHFLLPLLLGGGA
jgi:uncharacterized membrane protein YedE/YeeE